MIESRTPPTCQIHYTGYNHWVMSFCSDFGDSVYVLHSICKGSLTTCLQMKLSQIYGTGQKAIHVQMPVMNQQRNGMDCGVLAIANKVEFCHTKFEDLKKGKHHAFLSKQC